MDVLACPSWSAVAREDRPAWSMRVATVLRKTWVVTQSKPAASKASLRSAWVLKGSRQPPSGAGNTHADDGAGDRERAGGEVDVGGAEGAGLADAQTGGEQDVDEIGQVLTDRGGVGARAGRRSATEPDAVLSLLSEPP